MKDLHGVETDRSERKAFSEWQANNYTDKDELLFEKRKAELNRLVRRVIKEELNEFDRKIVELHWYKGLSQSETAERMDVDRSTVNRHFSAINETIYEKLKYAIELIYQSAEKPQSFLEDKGNGALSSGINSDEISIRLKLLRDEKSLTVEGLSEKTDISPSRIISVEKNGGLMTMTELKKLTAFYGTTYNYIIFGTN